MGNAKKGKGLIRLLMVFAVVMILVSSSAMATSFLTSDSPTGFFGAIVGVLFSWFKINTVNADAVLDTFDEVGYARDNIRITEVWANPTGADKDYEFFEVSNLGDSDITITCGKAQSDWGWTHLHARADGASPEENDFHIFGEYGECEDFILAAGDSVVLGKNVAALAAKFPDANCQMVEYREDLSINNEGDYYEGHAPGLSDPTGDEISVWIGRNNAFNVEIDSVYFYLANVDDSENSLHFLGSSSGLEGAPTPCVAAGGTTESAAGNKEQALSILETLSTSDKKSQKELDKAILRVTQSLGNRIDGGDSSIIWLDVDHLDCQHGHKAFDDEKQAVGHLNGITDSALQSSVDQAIELLVKADMLLAETAISEASDSKDKDKAVEDFNEGEAESDSRQKIQDYRKAWKNLC